MKQQYSYIVNNYTLGAKVKTTPRDRIISQNRIDRNHTELIYEFDSTSGSIQRQKEFCDMVLARKGKLVKIIANVG